LHEAPPDDTPPSKDPLDKISEESPSWSNHHPSLKGYILDEVIPLKKR